MPGVVPRDVQAIVDKLVHQDHSSPAASAAASAAEGSAAALATADVAPGVLVGGRLYRVPNACILAIPLLAWYSQSVEALPGQAPEITLRVVEVLRKFNTVTYKMVLNAGAMASVGLKSITVKHIGPCALPFSFFICFILIMSSILTCCFLLVGCAAQSLDLLAALVPPLKAQILSVLPPSRKAVTFELDGVVEVFGTHRYEPRPCSTCLPVSLAHARNT